VRPVPWSTTSVTGTSCLPRSRVRPRTLPREARELDAVVHFWAGCTAMQP
jgi:hypothetical protein